MDRLIIQKHCEIVEVKPDPKEKGTYAIRFVLTNGAEEYVPEITPNFHGSAKEIAKILSYLGDEFNRSKKVENALADLSIAPITFKLEGDDVIGEHNGEVVFHESIPQNLEVAKVREFSEKFFSERK
jgi:hypothetical protein